jgi:Sugar (and other) transporter
MLGVGTLCASWISYGTYIGFSPTNSAQWRISLGIQIIPAVLLGSLIMVFPEVWNHSKRSPSTCIRADSNAQSPRWLIDNGRESEGLRVLAQLHSHGDENDSWVRAEFGMIQESITYEHENEAKSYVELFKSRSAFRRLFLCCALQASVQMTGVSAIQ